MNFKSINKHPIWGLFLAIGLGLVPASIFIWPSEHGGGFEIGIAIFFAIIAAFIFINSILGFRRLRSGMTDGDVQMSRSGFWKGFFSAIALVFLWFIVVMPQYHDYASRARWLAAGSDQAKALISKEISREKAMTAKFGWI